MVKITGRACGLWNMYRTKAVQGAQVSAIVQKSKSDGGNFYE
ncbi:hypothetical protein [Lactonifactor longoviformis]|nr:hypothetical protein [Lactonifactor longoviformis]